MHKETIKPHTQPPVDRESVRLLAIELGVREAARRCGLSEDRVRKWSSRYKWLEQRAPKQQQAAVTVVTKPGDVLLATHKELETTTKTALMQTAAKAATHAAQNPPLDVSNTSQFRDLATSSGRIFGWDKKAGPQTQFNQVVISQEQLREIGMLRDKITPEESEEVSRKLSEMTPEEMEEFGRKARELLARARNMEQPKLPPTPSDPVTCEVKIRGDGRGVEIRENNEH